MQTPDKIWLIDLGDEVTWCDSPTPAPGIDEADTVEYIKPKVQDKITRHACAEAIMSSIEYELDEDGGLSLMSKDTVHRIIMNCKGGL